MVREYTRVHDDTRATLIKLIHEGKSIKEAAEIVDINYENAKAINRMYRQENRVEKKKHRIRVKKFDKQSLIEAANPKTLIT